MQRNEGSDSSQERSRAPVAHRAEAGRPLHDYVEAEFDAYLKCGRLEAGLLRLRCEQCRRTTLGQGSGLECQATMSQRPSVRR